MKKKWIEPTIDRQQLDELCHKFAIESRLAAILLSRGYCDATLLLYLLEKNSAALHEPFLLSQLDTAVSRCWQAIEKKEPILIVGDHDFDGFAAATVIVQGLGKLGANLLWQGIINCGNCTIDNEKLQWAIAQGTKLIIIADSGMSATTIIDAGRQQGVDTIIIDHHLPQQQLPAAVAIVNPTISSNYPFPAIAATVVAGKFIWAMGFQQSRYYNQKVTLVYYSNNNQVAVATLLNMIEVERQHYNLRTAKSLHAFNKQLAASLVIIHFGQEQLGDSIPADLAAKVCDLAPKFYQQFPQFATANLAKITSSSSRAKYLEQTPLDCLINIFKLLIKDEIALAENLLSSSIDLMALASLADSMPMHNENRVIVRRGISAINCRIREGLWELACSADLLTPPYSYKLLMTRLIPLINSAGRMGQAPLAMELLLSNKVARRRHCADQLLLLNQQRKKISFRAAKLLQSQVYDVLNEWDNKLIVLRNNEIYPSLTGVLANRIMQLFNLPTILATTNQQGLVSASLRAPPGNSITTILTSGADLYAEYGGHQAAAGFRLRQDLWPELLQRLRRLMPQLPPRKPPVWKIDFEVTTANDFAITESIAAALEPYGTDHKQFIFLYRNVTITKIEPFGHNGRHLKFFCQKDQQSWWAIFWHATETHSGEVHVDDVVDIIYKIETHNKYGQSRRQYILQDLRRTK